MKRKLLIIIGLFGATTCVAQQALWSGGGTASPVLNADSTVTFRLHAPKAGAVRVTGDFLSGREDGVMTERDGMWEYTTPAPLAPELYSYNFEVDGLRITDPANVHQVRDVGSVSNVFLVGGGNADNYRVQDVPHGTVAKMWYHSPSAAMDRRMTVYTPAGYEDSPERSYPVLYLLHGMGGDENSWSDLGRATQILDNLIACGKAEPMIVVMPNGNISQSAAPGESSSGFVTPTMDLPNTMDGKFEEHFPELVDFIDNHFRTERTKEGRAIAGLSMGGFHAAHISKDYPDMFDYVGLFSAAYKPREGVESPVYTDWEQKLARQFGTAPALYWIGIGDSDFLYEDNVEYRQMLDSHGYPYTYFETPGGHIWRNWRIYLSEFVPRLFKK